MIHESSLKFHERVLFKKLKNHESSLFYELNLYKKSSDSTKIYKKKRINNKPVHGLSSNKN